MASPRMRARPRSIVIVTSTYNATVTEALEAGALSAFEAAAPAGLVVEVYRVPGAFELVPACAAAANDPRCVGVVALGCIIKGETIHDEVLAHSVTQALAAISATTGRPVGLGVLTVSTNAQALARAGGKSGSGASNKGGEAMEATLATLTTLGQIARGTGLAVGAAPAQMPVRDKLRTDPAAKHARVRRPRRRDR